jgi:hypothetical protein
MAGTEALDGGLDDPLAKVGRSDVAVACRRMPAERLDHRQCLLRGRLIEIIHDHAGAVAREPQRDLLADAASGPGHDRYFSVELSHVTFPESLSVKGLATENTESTENFQSTGAGSGWRMPSEGICIFSLCSL